jgi:predicted O-methyltransferase YrrM
MTAMASRQGRSGKQHRQRPHPRPLRRRRAEFLEVGLAAAVVAPLTAAAALVSGAAAAVMGATAATAALGILLTRTERRLRRRMVFDRGATDAAIRRGNRELFVQLEALASLRDATALTHPLPATGGWAASADFLVEIIRHVQSSGPLTVLELGSGTSSVVVAACLRRGGGGRLVSLEHQPEYAELTRRELTAQGLDDIATVVDAPLVATTLGAEMWRWYDLGGLGLEGSVDVLLVDGPPADTGRLARYPALPLLLARLGPNATILVDDGDRDDERAMVARWQAEIPGLHARYLELTKGAYVVTRG